MTIRMPSRMALYQSVRRVRIENGCTRRSGLQAQHVSRASNRVKQPALALAVDLAAEVADVHVDDVALRVEVEPPHVLGDHGPRQHAVDIAEEVLEQRVLARGERDAARATGGGARGGIEREIVELDNRRALACAPSQQRPDPGQELVEAERL